MISVFLPLRVVSTMNAREHWSRRAARAKEQRKLAALIAFPQLRNVIVGCPPHVAVAVTLTRISPRPLDSDNLAAGFKAIRDGVADALGLRDDADPRVTWSYAQQRGKPREYACRVEIRPRDASSDGCETARPVKSPRCR